MGTSLEYRSETFIDDLLYAFFQRFVFFQEFSRISR
jgi:hypothetical protein